MRDLTEKRKAEAESKRYAKRFQMLIEQTAFGIWVTSIEDENTTYVNDSMAQTLGYSPHEMIGVPVLDFVTPRGAEILKEKTRLRLTNQNVENTYPLEFYTRSGKVVSTIITAAALKDEKGKVIETCGFIEDVTEPNPLIIFQICFPSTLLPPNLGYLLYFQRFLSGLP